LYRYVEGGALQAAGANEINPAAAVAAPILGKRHLLHDHPDRRLRQRRLLQLDALNPAEGDAGALASKLVGRVGRVSLCTMLIGQPCIGNQ
jgi:hypothetical protein